jgi:predicted MFS family arabinose efflux permease
MRPNKTPAYMLVLLMAVVCTHSMDRLGFSMVLGGVKHSMALSDTQLGLLAGPAFALLNAAAALPLARVADMFGRKRVLAGCTMLWSAFTGLTGLASGFAGLALTRACVGLADAAAMPVSQSLLAAASAPARRPGVLAMLTAGSYGGTVLGFALSGVLAQQLGWRAALMCLGAPGVVLGALVWLTLSEPEEPRPAQTLPRVWLSDWLPVVRTARFIDATMAVASGEILGWAAFAWLPSFYQRSYGMTPSEIGFWLAGAVGVGAAVGAIAGGALTTRLSVRWPGAGMWLSFWTTLASAPLLTAAFMTDSKAISLLCVLLSGVTGAVCMGPIAATVQGLADHRTRATLAAVFGIANTLLGQAVGPLLVGAVSDLSVRYYGSESLRFSLEVVSVLGFWPAVHLYRLARGTAPRAAVAAAA